MEIVLCEPVERASHAEWTIEIQDGVQRLMVTPRGFCAGDTQPRVWGFLADGRQVEGRIVHHDPQAVWVA